MFETLTTILLTVINGLFGVSGVLFFYKINKRKAAAEADGLEIKNLADVQTTYQKLVQDQTNEIIRLNEKVDKFENKVFEFENKLVMMCEICIYKKQYHEK